MKEDREPDLSDYKEFKLKEDNIGFQMLQKLGWSEGQGLGSEGTGIVDPIGRSVIFMCPCVPVLSVLLWRSFRSFTFCIALQS